MDKKITRIDMERIGASAVMVRKWYEGWHQNDAGAPDIEEFVESGSISYMLAEYEKQGYTVEMASQSKGRALRGKITRVDIILEGETWVMKKYPYGWTAKTRPIETKRFNHEEAQIAIQWLKDNRWVVLEWPGGARAWKGRPMPVRDRHAIQVMRRKFDEQKINFSYNLALYF